MRGGGRQGRSPGFNAYVGFRQRWREKQRDKSFKKKKSSNGEKVQLLSESLPALV